MMPPKLWPFRWRRVASASRSESWLRGTLPRTVARSSKLESSVSDYVLGHFDDLRVGLINPCDPTPHRPKWRLGHLLASSSGEATLSELKALLSSLVGY